MDVPVEHELCNNCKKEIPHFNYVMHTLHCAKNITLCQICKEPIPKNQFEDHKKACKPTPKQVKKVPLTNIEKSDYFQERKSIEDKKASARRSSYLERHEKFIDRGYSLRESSVDKSREDRNSQNTRDSRDSYPKTNGYGGARARNTPNTIRDTTSVPVPTPVVSKPQPLPQRPVEPKLVAPKPAPKKSNGLLPCRYCDLELPKLDLEEHENYCGTRTDKCLECGELVMYKNKQVHLDSNHGFVKLNDEPGPRPSWDSQTQRTATEERQRIRPMPFTPFTTLDAMLYQNFPPQSPAAPPKEKGESYKEISRRLDCKTEYIRNLLHDSASITVPLRHNGAVPRNHFNHNKGPAPQPPRRRPNPPTELVIPCEFCSTPIPHEDLIQHETGCRPDLARRRRSPSPDDYFIAPQPSSPDVELPCEFCADMIPASQLLRHQATCS